MPCLKKGPAPRLFRHAAMLALLIAGMAVLPAAAEPPAAAINPDVLTISGRYGLPKGDKQITHRRLRVGVISIAPEAMAGLAYDSGGFKFALEQGLIKSLANHDLLARPDDADPIVVQIEVPAFTYVEVADIKGTPGSTAATALLRVTTTNTDPAIITCVAYEGRGEFKALHRQKSGGGKRATGVIAAVVIGVINPFAINTFTPQSFSNADIENQNLNANRSVSSNEGVSPGFDARSDTTYAATNALQLAIYNYLYHQLTDNPACTAPAPLAPPPVDVTSAPANPPPVITESEPAIQTPLVIPESPPQTAAPATDEKTVAAPAA